MHSVYWYTKSHFNDFCISELLIVEKTPLSCILQVPSAPYHFTALDFIKFRPSYGLVKLLDTGQYFKPSGRLIRLICLLWPMYYQYISGVLAVYSILPLITTLIEHK